MGTYAKRKRRGQIAERVDIPTLDPHRADCVFFVDGMWSIFFRNRRVPKVNLKIAVNAGSKHKSVAFLFLRLRCKKMN